MVKAKETLNCFIEAHAKNVAKAELAQLFLQKDCYCICFAFKSTESLGIQCKLLL